MPLGLLVAGPIASPMVDAAGLKVTFPTLALPILAIGLITSELPSLRDVDRAPQFAPDPGL